MQPETRAFWRTWLDATFRPGTFFAESAAARSRMPAVLFAVIIGAVASASTFGVEVLWRTRAPGPVAVGLVFGLLYGPAATLLDLVIEAAIAHGLLRLTGSTTRPFKATFDAFCHAYAPGLLAAVPVLGPLVGGVWRIVTSVYAIKRTHGTGAGRTIIAIVAGPVLVLAVALGLRAFVIEAYKIPAGSMIPTLEVGDHLFVNKLSFHLRSPARGEVIVFTYPPDPSKDFVKRVVAVGGDTVELRHGALVVNGVEVARARDDAPCRYWDLDESADEWRERGCVTWHETLGGRSYDILQDPGVPEHDFPPVTVPRDHVYVLGDNRDNSHDSRYWGTVPLALVKGPVKLIWWSQGGPDGNIRWSRLGKRVR